MWDEGFGRNNLERANIWGEAGNLMRRWRGQMPSSASQGEPMFEADRCFRFAPTSLQRIDLWSMFSTKPLIAETMLANIVHLKFAAYGSSAADRLTWNYDCLSYLWASEAIDCFSRFKISSSPLPGRERQEIEVACISNRLFKWMFAGSLRRNAAKAGLVLV